MFLDDLTQEELEAVEGIGVVRNYAGGVHVIEEGTVGTSFCFVLSGRVEVRKQLQQLYLERELFMIVVLNRIFPGIELLPMKLLTNGGEISLHCALGRIPG